MLAFWSQYLLALIFIRKPALALPYVLERLALTPFYFELQLFRG